MSLASIHSKGVHSRSRRATAPNISALNFASRAIVPISNNVNSQQQQQQQWTSIQIERSANYNRHNNSQLPRYLYRNYLARLKHHLKLDEQTLPFQITRLCVIYIGGYLCGLDLLGRSNRERFGAAATGSSSGKRAGALGLLSRLCARKLPVSSWRQTLKSGWISNAMVVVYLCFTFQVTLITYQLYMNDISRFRLNKLREWIAMYGDDQPVPSPHQAAPRGADHDHNNSNSSHPRPMRVLVDELMQRIAHTDRQLIFPGHLLSDYGMFIQSASSYMLLLCFSIYLVPRLIYHWFVPFDLHTIRDLIDHKGEQIHVNSVCRQEVELYIRSSRFHDFNQLYLLPTLPDQVVITSGADDSGRSVLECGPELRPDDTRACHQLVKMLKQHALCPANRSKPWIWRRTRIQFVLHFIMICYVLGVDISCIVSVRLLAMPLVPEPNLATVLAEISIYGTIFIIGAVVAFIGPIWLITCWDQAASAEELIRLVGECIKLNQQGFEHYQAGMGRRIVDISQTNRLEWRHHRMQLAFMADRMNANYLFALMSYKIFIAQLRPYKRTQQPYIMLVLFMAILMPIFIKLHLPYFELAVKFDSRMIRLLSFALSFTILLVTNTVLFPVCRVYSRCSKIYNALSSLMAEIILVKWKYPYLYDQHAVSMLAKELRSPERFLNQFALHCIGIPVTYPTWLKFHFYWGIVALSMIFDSEYEEENYGFFLRDPLGVYWFN